MLLAAVLLGAVLLAAVLLLMTNHRLNPLVRASRKIIDALREDKVRDDRLPSQRTRSSLHVEHVMHYDKTDVSARENERFRVRNFAHALRSLPLRDNGAIRRVEGVNLTTPNVAWTPHKSGRSLLEHHGLLPRLHSVKDDDAAVSLHAAYAAQRDLRRRGNSVATWQMAEGGAVTLPHVDDDLNGVTMGTYLAVVEGAQLIVAWRRDELHEDEVLLALKGPASK